MEPLERKGITMSFLNEQAAENAGKEIASRYFGAHGGYHKDLPLREEALALICKLAFEAGVQSVLKAEQAIQDEQDEQARDEQDP